MSAELAALASDPERVQDVRADALPRLIGEAEALKAALWARLQSAQVPVAPPPVQRNGGPDQLLTADQAAEQLGVTKRWMYRHADELPFTRRLSSNALRFSARGLERYKETR